MAWFRKKRQRQPAITRAQALACTPVRNNVVSWERQESGLIQIEYMLVLKPFLLSIFARFSPQQAQEPTRKLLLDELGSQVWDMLDGTRSTVDIIKEFADLHGISTQESEQSVTVFLRELGKRGLIALR